MVIFWATKLRGFLRHISEVDSDVQFVGRDNYYEISGFKKNLKSKLIRSRLLDLPGVFQVLKAQGKDCDGYGSFNRFLDADKPYFIYLENPTALYHYALGRVRRGAGRKKFEKCLNDPNLRAIVCMSEACRSTFERINMPVPAHVDLRTIYPLVPKNNRINEECIHQKSYAEVLECLYCVQGKSFYTKGGRDVLEVVTRLQDSGCRIHLTVITNISALQEDTLRLIEGRDGITLHDFTLTYEQMEEVYANTAVLLQPSSADSFGLTVLEAMKGGCAVLGSKLYAFPEMVYENENGILIDPMYWTFTPDNMPNPIAWGYHKKVRLCKKRSQTYVNDIERALRAMYENRDMVFAFGKRSLEIADTKFGVDTICDQWKEVWNELERTEHEA